MRTVVFDLDGTLADTSRDLIAAANHCFERLGLGAPLDPVADAATAFAGGRAMLRLGFARIGRGAGGKAGAETGGEAGGGAGGSAGGGAGGGAGGEAAVDAQYPVLLAAYAAGIDTHTRLYPGAAEAVAALRAAGFSAAVCTNKPEALARELLARLGVAGLFGALVGADTLPVRKPDPAPYRRAVEAAGGTVARSFLVGDTVTDRDTARAAGVPVALVTFGPEGQGVARLAPDALLHGFDELPALAGRLLGPG